MRFDKKGNGSSSRTEKAVPTAASAEAPAAAPVGHTMRTERHIADTNRTAARAGRGHQRVHSKSHLMNKVIILGTLIPILINAGLGVGAFFLLDNKFGSRFYEYSFPNRIIEGVIVAAGFLVYNLHFFVTSLCYKNETGNKNSRKLSNWWKNHKGVHLFVLLMSFVIPVGLNFGAGLVFDRNNDLFRFWGPDFIGVILVAIACGVNLIIWFVQRQVLYKKLLGKG